MRKAMLVTVTVLGSLLIPAQSAEAIDEINTARLRKAVTVNGILAHERALQRIANRNDGTRASGTPGFRQSADYVKGQLTAAGYQVTEQEFTFPFFRDLADPTLSQVSPTPTDYETATFTYSGSGGVTGAVIPTNDVQIPPAPTPGSTSGCEAADFPAAPPTGPAVALIQRGTCSFEIKTQNALDAGYDAVIIFNEGQPGRQDLIQGTLGRPFAIPVVGLSFADGEALYNATKAGAVTVQVTTSTETDLEAKTSNIIADSTKGNADKTVVVGAHLDSVAAGPGINDNGSGTSTVLEIAKQMSKLKITPRQKMRFAFWGAEEFGLLGSEHYVDSLPADQLGQIYANLNFDMLGSPNYVRFVYDGDGSDTAGRRPARLRADRDDLRQVLRGPGSGNRADRVRRPFRLRAVHRGRDPGRRPVQRGGGDQDGRAGRCLRWHGRCRLRRLLPPGLRHRQQPQHQGPERTRGRRGARHDDPGQDPVRILRGRQPGGRPAGREPRGEGSPGPALIPSCPAPAAFSVPGPAAGRTRPAPAAPGEPARRPRTGRPGRPPPASPVRRPRCRPPSACRRTRR